MSSPAARRAVSWASSAVVALMAVSCGGPATSSPQESTTAPGAAGTGGRVTVENCGRTLTFDAPPEQVVSLWQAPTEMMLALGVQDRLAAVAGTYADLPPDLEPAARGVPAIGTAMGWPSRETLLSTEPDLVVSQLLEGFAFDTSLGYASVEEIEQGGAQVYSANACDLAGNQEMTLETPQETLRDLGTIFDRSAEAERIIGGMEARHQAVVDAVQGLPAVDVAYYNGGEGPLTVLTGGIYSDAIATAGGRSVFPDDAMAVSAEEFAASDADVVLVGTYPGQDFAALRDYLVATFPELPAVREGRIAEVPVTETDASVRVMDGLTRIAAALHPEAAAALPAP